ncbi:TetR/AcrR family transcriptional regulator [Aestuariispira insulae]|uniref:TetR family transcriptional regulator n=1 Tax=Aestuariispira insulae TaxID=1461337 RepID=A0A3D9HWC1_9PROT|nr:TetR/AcrR family transcriptional regulator [Aestuariispira insulae]RED53767.1 TetR family transcriptional regulator [Aestuariispira insulae]
MPEMPKRGRGRPKKQDAEKNDIRAQLVRSGIEILTAKGFSSMGLDELLERAGVPKGSFYYYFDSKEAYGLAVIAGYGEYFAKRLDRSLLRSDISPLQRLRNFIADGENGMMRHDFRRGCLVGNLGQEMGATHDVFREVLEDTLKDWEGRVAVCLEQARDQGEIAADADCHSLATFFWIGWEGAVLRAKLVRSLAPMKQFAQVFFDHLPKRLTERG